MDRKLLGEKLVREAGLILMTFFGAENTSQSKGLKDLVLEADLKAEEYIISLVRQNFPSDSILSEEAGETQGTSEFRWIVDPLDGTANFKANIPYFCVSIGIEINGELNMAFVYDPNQKNYFFAEKRKSSYLNGKKISVSKEEDISKFLFSYSTSNHKSKEVVDSGSKSFHNILTHCRAIRLKGSSILDLCNLASGVFDGLIKVGANYWDFAPGCLIVEEAGGKVTDFDGGQWNSATMDLIASNGAMHEELLSLIVSN